MGTEKTIQDHYYVLAKKPEDTKYSVVSFHWMSIDKEARKLFSGYDSLIEKNSSIYGFPEDLAREAEKLLKERGYEVVMANRIDVIKLDAIIERELLTGLTG